MGIRMQSKRKDKLHTHATNTHTPTEWRIRRQEEGGKGNVIGLYKNAPQLSCTNVKF